MDKKEFFLKALRDNAHYSREWVLRCFSVVIDDPAEIPWAIKHTPDGVVFFNHEINQWDTLDGVDSYEVPFVYHEPAGALQPGDLLNVKKPIVDTTYGQILVNARVLVYACGDLIDFMEGEIKPSMIEEIFIQRMKSDPPPGEEDQPGELYVKHWLKVGKAVGDLDGFELFIPSITEHALQPYPGLEEDRSKLLSEAEDLEDPVTQAKIQNELVSKYKDYLKGDPSEGFLIKGKSINTSLKQMFLIHGPEAGFDYGGRAVMVPNSLDEGTDVKYFPEMINSLRAGSYYRGAMTALAGTDVDLVSRIFQSVAIQPEFCGTKETIALRMDKRYLGRWINVDGKRVMLTDENIDQFKDSVQSIYDPITCKAGGVGVNDVCSVCIGSRMAAYPTSLGMAASQKQSTLMYVMMSAAHAKELATVPLKEDYLE